MGPLEIFGFRVVASESGLDAAVVVSEELLDVVAVLRVELVEESPQLRSTGDRVL